MDALERDRREREARVLAMRIRRMAPVRQPGPCSDCLSPWRVEAEIKGQHDEARKYCATCYALRMFGLGGAEGG